MFVFSPWTISGKLRLNLRTETGTNPCLSEAVQWAKLWCFSLFNYKLWLVFFLQFLLPNYRRFLWTFIIGIEKRHNFSMSFASSVYNQNVFIGLIFLLAWSVKLLLSAEEMPTSCLGFPPLIIHALTMRLPSSLGNAAMNTITTCSRLDGCPSSVVA